ncbi:MAG: 16S rRNA processing protein RimM, partial [Clostridia bacterium]|nr:16S rRNA processing protein RimM [Clostridia bacterium]
MKQQYIETGKITGTHGIRGEMRVQPWCDSPEDLLQYKVLYLNDIGSESLQVAGVRVHKSMVILKVKGIDSIAQAEAYRERVVYIHRDDMDLAEGQYLVAELIGCRVYHKDTDALLGTITDVSQTGANDVWHISRDGK